MTTNEQRHQVEAWEDGRRQVPGDERAELWHFEGSLTNGMTFAIGFCLVGIDPKNPDHYQTVVNVMLTAPDGGQYVHAIAGTVHSDAVGTQRCLLPFGPNTVDGDLRTYDLHVVTEDETLSLDLQYVSSTDPFAPRIASPVLLGQDPEHTFAELIVARCAVSGTVTMNGVRTEVEGIGTHDHQWFDSNPLTTWHHWIWGRLCTEHYTAVLFDLVASSDLGYQRIPIFGVFDAAGTLIFDNGSPTELEVDLAADGDSGKSYPRRCVYRFRDTDRAFVLQVDWLDNLISTDLYAAAGGSDELGGASKEQFDRMGVQPSYARCRATGRLTITDHDTNVSETGEVFYELNYPALNDPATFTTSP